MSADAADGPVGTSARPVGAGRSGPTATSATIAPHILRYLDLVLAEAELDLGPALLRAGLPRELLDQPTLRVSHRQGRLVIERALELLPDPALGLLVGARQHLASAGILGLGMMASATLAEGMQLGLRFQNLVGSMVEWGFEVRGPELAVTATLRPGSLGDRVDAFLVEEGLSSIDRMARGCVAPSFRPLRVEFAHRTADRTGTHRRTFEAPVQFGADRNAWVIDAAAAARPLPGADRWTLTQVAELLEEQVDQQVDHQELVVVLAEQIAADLPEVASMASHARRMAQSERSLRRRLSESGTSFAALLDEVRQHRVEHLLRSPGRGLGEIARAAGFTDERSLRRAVQRWFGTGPSAVRAAWHAERTGQAAPGRRDDPVERA